jgi:hypothetical protein
VGGCDVRLICTDTASDTAARAREETKLLWPFGDPMLLYGRIINPSHLSILYDKAFN